MLGGFILGILVTTAAFCILSLMSSGFAFLFVRMRRWSLKVSMEQTKEVIESDRKAKKGFNVRLEQLRQHGIFAKEEHRSSDDNNRWWRGHGPYKKLFVKEYLYDATANGKSGGNAYKVKRFVACMQCERCGMIVFNDNTREL